MKRYLFVLVSCVLMASMLLTACAANPATPPAPAEPTATTAAPAPAEPTATTAAAPAEPTATTAAAPAEPTATIVTDAVDYCRLVANRIAPGDLDVQVEGDADLAERVLVGASMLALD